MKGVFKDFRCDFDFPDDGNSKSTRPRGSSLRKVLSSQGLMGNLISNLNSNDRDREVIYP
jgi:hypothetical protein